MKVVDLIKERGRGHKETKIDDTWTRDINIKPLSLVTSIEHSTGRSEVFDLGRILFWIFILSFLRVGCVHVSFPRFSWPWVEARARGVSSSLRRTRRIYKYIIADESNKVLTRSNQTQLTDCSNNQLYRNNTPPFPARGFRKDMLHSKERHL